MSMPLYQQPPPVSLTQISYNNHSGHSSIGPLIAVLVVIIVLGILAGMIGRLCSGQRIMGYGEYDVESWAERKCSSCIDGRMHPPLPRPSNNNVSPVPPSISVQIHQETQSSQNQLPDD